jgi:CubicO group peptidase (beta-lactamase class C family)
MAVTPPVDAPGSQVGYSNSGHPILGLLAELLTTVESAIGG